MKKIRFLREFIATQGMETGGRIATERKPGEAYQRVTMTVGPKHCVFTLGEEIETLLLQVEGELKLVSARMDKRNGAILDKAKEGMDFEYIA